MIAGIIAFVLVSLFMILMFRLTGFVAVISLIGQVALCFAAVSGYFPAFNSFTLTLPGIAGIILSIGMGVGRQHHYGNTHQGRTLGRQIAGRRHPEGR